MTRHDKPGWLGCSFCGKEKTDVQKQRLIAGPDVYICQECVLLCVEILITEDAAPPPDLDEKEIKHLASLAGMQDRTKPHDDDY